MRSFQQLDGLVVPLDRANVDTDAIVPKQFMKSVSRTGYGGNLFDEWRYLDHGEPGMDVALRPINSAFVLNQPRYKGARILLARENFGCGSSREHAVWALSDFGIRALIAPSFADIFYGNCFKNGILPIVLDAYLVDQLFSDVERKAGFRLRIDLSVQSIESSIGQRAIFNVDPERKRRLLAGLDEIALTLSKSAAIRAYEVRRFRAEPWLFE